MSHRFGFQTERTVENRTVRNTVKSVLIGLYIYTGMLIDKNSSWYLPMGIHISVCFAAIVNICVRPLNQRQSLNKRHLRFRSSESADRPAPRSRNKKTIDDLRRRVKSTGSSPLQTLCPLMATIRKHENVKRENAFLNL